VPALPKEVRAARAFLQKKGVRSHEVPPRRFADAAKELDIGFTDLLSFISRLYSGGQNQQQFRMDVIAKEASATAAVSRQQKAR
jgi:hypothetical protein